MFVGCYSPLNCVLKLHSNRSEERLLRVTGCPKNGLIPMSHLLAILQAPELKLKPHLFPVSAIHMLGWDVTDIKLPLHETLSLGLLHLQNCDSKK